MEQLRKMGITAGSLFPGLDRNCEVGSSTRFFEPPERHLPLTAGMGGKLTLPIDRQLVTRWCLFQSPAGG